MACFLTITRKGVAQAMDSCLGNNDVTDIDHFNSKVNYVYIYIYIF